jgi:hypothetical protein
MHEMDYWPIFGEARPSLCGGFFKNQPPHYDRVYLISVAIKAGYESIIWLDADCVILGCEDMRRGVPDDDRSAIGALWCEAEWADPEQYNHWCTGALYIKANWAADFIGAWIKQDFMGHGWIDQHAFNLVSRDKYFKDVVTPISRHWHAILPNFLPEDDSTPQVLALHGYGTLEQRLETMRLLFTQNGAVE